MTLVESSYVGLDPRSDLWGDPGWPAWVTGFRPHQEEAFAKIIGHFDSGADVVLLNAPTGCLAGETMVGVNRGGNGRSYPLSTLTYRFNGGLIKTGSNRQWDPAITTNVQRSDGETMRLGALAAAYSSGVKLTYTLRTEGGKVIRATADHRFMTDDGWATLGELSVDMKVHVLLGQGGRSKGIKPWYNLTSGIPEHPYCGRKGVKPGKGGFSVPKHRLVIEADMNGLSFEDFVAQLRAGSVEGLEFLDPMKWEVHHIDEDPRNNTLDNLAIHTSSSHHREHAVEGRWRDVNFHVGLDTIESIEEFGMEETFDLSMADEPHNFIANGFVVHNSGKSILAEMTRRGLGALTTLYCPDTKDLQDQFMSDFGTYAKLLKGRSNYPTLDNPLAFNDRWSPLTAGDCAKKKELIPACSGCNHVADAPQLHCRLCHPWFKCPYEIAKREAMGAELAVLNTSYFITEANGPGMFSKRDFVIIDEADTLEAALMNNVEVLITERRRIELDIDFPHLKTVSASWVEWVNMEAIPKVGTALAMINPDTSETDELRQIKYLSSLSGKLMKLREALEEGNAVYDGYQKGEIKFQPVNVAPFAKDMVWKHAERFLLMSATIIDPQEFVESLGIERAGMRWELVNVPSVFPAERRPIHVKHAANMVFKETDTAWPKMAAMVKRVLEEKHPDDRVLVHTVSYKFSQYLFDQLRTSGREILVYSSAKERAGILDMFKKIPNAVLLAPSMDRGIDLPGDLCRAVIVTKMPYANTKDKRVEARTYGTRNGRQWYNVQTIRKLIQMTGRGMRSEDDFCDVWILDEQFTTRVFKQNKGLFPKWWSEALDWSGGGL